jgi:hypothetical protein
MQRHLAAFETLDAHTGARGLALAAAPTVLPAPEPMPRPMRKRFFREPYFGAISFSFIAVSLFPVHDADEMLHFFDHPARHRIVRQVARAADLIQPEPDQGLALGVLPTQRAADLLDLDGFVFAGHGAFPAYSVAASLSAP